MDTPLIQTAIKLVAFSVIDVDLKVDPNCQIAQITKTKLNIELLVGAGFSTDKLRNYTVTLNLKVTDDYKYMSLIVKSVAFFETQDNITDDFKGSTFVNINSPAIAFPFLRSFVNTLTTNAGLNPVILPAFNFSAK